jgi:hypothetical protein
MGKLPRISAHLAVFSLSGRVYGGITHLIPRNLGIVVSGASITCLGKWRSIGREYIRGSREGKVEVMKKGERTTGQTGVSWAKEGLGQYRLR